MHHTLNYIRTHITFRASKYDGWILLKYKNLLAVQMTEMRSFRRFCFADEQTEVCKKLTDGVWRMPLLPGLPAIRVPAMHYILSLIENELWCQKIVLVN